MTSYMQFGVGLVYLAIDPDRLVHTLFAGLVCCDDAPPESIPPSPASHASSLLRDQPYNDLKPILHGAKYLRTS